MTASQYTQNVQSVDIWTALRRVKPHILRTPLLFSPSLSKRTGAQIYLKMECWQKCGCFKVRGAINMVSALSEEERKRGLVTCSSGNHGLALSYASTLFGLASAKIFVPVSAEPSKVNKIKMYGGRVIPFGKDYLETLNQAFSYAEENRKVFVHSHDHPLIISGQGTIGLEIMEDLPDVESVIVPVGGGGLISGISIAVKSVNPKVELIGVEPTAAPGAYVSFKDGYCHEHVHIRPSLADGLLGTLTPLTFGIAQKYVNEIKLVEETEIVDAMRVFQEDEQIVVEGSAAVGLAVILTGKVRTRGQKIVLVLTGRNVSHVRYGEILTGVYQNAEKNRPLKNS